jgi:hypothetical protein
VKGQFSPGMGRTSRKMLKSHDGLRNEGGDPEADRKLLITAMRAATRHQNLVAKKAGIEAFRARNS